MKTPKAKYDIKTSELKLIGIKLADFLNDPSGAVWDAAGDIGEDKGYGSEGIGELNQELWEQLGVDYDDVEFLQPVGTPADDDEFESNYFTVDGKAPNLKAIEIANVKSLIKTAKADLRDLEKRLLKLTDRK